MDKNRVASILAAYSPPLSPSQTDAISTEISRISDAEVAEAAKKARAEASKLRHGSQSPRDSAGIT